jgi:hypothetical protein
MQRFSLHETSSGLCRASGGARSPLSSVSIGLKQVLAISESETSAKFAVLISQLERTVDATVEKR